jgi:glycosyltransferase involved in cell wall biosynthesis
VRVWLVTVGEPLPQTGSTPRLLRTGLLAEMLSRSGNDVVWWTSTFDHWRKQHLADDDHTVQLASNYQLRMLHGPGYSRNVSLDRIRDHREVARRFAEQSRLAPRPDVILCSLPTLELCAAAVRYGQQHNVPVVIDVRDMWPDALEALAPRPLRWLARLAVYPMTREARFATRNATAILGHAPAFVDWGLRHAGRSRTKWDRDFPFGYRTQELDPGEDAQARQFWTTQGLLGDSSELIVSFTGTVGLQQDWQTVIAAAKLLEGKPVRFVICGDGEMLESVRIASRGLTNVTLPGWIADVATLRVLLESSDVGLAPYIERFDFLATIPNKGPEYLSAGLPIALSLGSGVLFDLIREHHCGFSYCGSPQMLAAELARLSSARSELREMKRRARLLFDDRFRAERVYEDLMNHLQAIVTDCEHRSDR